jgi:endoglucanase
VDVSPNRGDGSVPCRRPNCPRRRRIFGCRGHDLRGGWYDAGDHGKYAVTTASTAWLLQYAHERARPAAPGALPEVLVEARWGLEWLLAAQLPGGDPQAGMVFHAVHDLSWTGLPLRPDQDPQPRTVRAPSTAATYGLAAVAAQAARVWEPYDAAFAARCTTAADQAWTAATTLPPAYARPEENVGGGPYDDDDVRDERYWAAAELAALTGADVYRYELHTTALDLNTALRNGFDWRSTAPLGLLTQALAPGWTAAADAAGARSLLTEAAAAIPSDGHGSPLTTYGWGSNARVLAHALVLPSADACLDYLLGRNALDTSYVTGYGTHTPTQPHHRFFAQALDPAYPPPPPGILVGGPNTGREDPVAAGALPESTPPQRCWVDDIGSWSTNEVSIGWNAALAVVAARSLRVRPCFIGQQPGVAAPGRRPAAPRLRPARITLRAA